MGYSDYSRRYRTISVSDAAPQGPALILARQECESSFGPSNENLSLDFPPNATFKIAFVLPSLYLFINIVASFYFFS
jgi:hypothetical protein